MLSVGVTQKEVRHFCEVRPSQFPVFIHPAGEFPRAIKLRERWEAKALDFPDHWGWIYLEFPDKLLHPGVTDA